MTILEIGCCGAYCRTCRAHTSGHCKGCKLGYDTGYSQPMAVLDRAAPSERDIDRAKCKMKLCCFRDHELQTCADCDEYLGCELIHEWFAKGHKYGKYRQAIEHIREYGYDSFLVIADGWKDASGRYG